MLTPGVVCLLIEQHWTVQLGLQQAWSLLHGEYIVATPIAMSERARCLTLYS